MPDNFFEYAITILTLVIIIGQILDRRDKVKSGYMDPVQDLKEFMTEKFHDGELRMSEIEHDIKDIKGDVSDIKKKQRGIEIDHQKIIRGLTKAVGSKKSVVESDGDTA